MINRLILALAAATAAAVEDTPDPSPKLRGAMATAIEAMREPRMQPIVWSAPTPLERPRAVCAYGSDSD